MDSLFSKQSVPMYLKVWERMKNGEDLLGDAEMIADAMKAHPEFDSFWPQGEMMFHPQEINGFIVNPLVHTGLHVAVEKQIFNQNPEEVAETFKALLAKGMPRHEALHQIAALWGNLYFRSVRRGGPMEEIDYLEGLKALAEGSTAPGPA